MTSKPFSKESPPELLLALGQAAQKVGKDYNDSHFQNIGDRAVKLTQQARREGKAGEVTDGKGLFVQVET
jgi:hypothetical protein